MARIVPVLLFALAFPTLMTWLNFGNSTPWMKATYGIGKVVQFSLPILWWAAMDRARLRRPGFSRAGLPAGLGFGLSVGLGILVLYFVGLRDHPVMVSVAEQARAKISAFGLTSPAFYLLFAVFLSLLHALLEEYYWRAFVFAELKKLVPVPVAVAISSLGFMAHHVIVLNVYFPGRFWTATVPLSLGIAAGGAVWTWMYHRFGTIYPGWIGHALIDATLMFVGYDLLFR